MLNKKIATAIATGAVLLNALAPMAFANTDVVAGNGAGSQNQVNTNNNNVTSVSQSNNANISNTVVSTATTGGNNASANTGGNTTVTSGNAISGVSVTNAANTNSALVNGNCNCQGGANTVGILDNGAGSANAVNSNHNNTTALGQTNNAAISNLITSDASTGGNNASANTGGNVTVTAGGAASQVSVANAANVNSAQIGSVGGVAGLSGDTVLISGNGAGSQNSANLNDNKTVSLGQSNSAVILNSVFSTAATGGNNASANTGGNVAVTSGPAIAKAHIVNEPNFNVASLNDCGCTTTGDLYKVLGNGAGSASAINANNNNILAVSTTNSELLSNFAIPTAATGGNDASANTGSVYGMITDPAVTSGGALTEVTIANGGNVNNVGNGAIALPGLGNVSFTSNFSGMWAAWMAFMSM